MPRGPGRGCCSGPGSAGLRGQSRARNPNVLGQLIGKTGVEFKTLTNKNHGRGVAGVGGWEG